MIQIPRNRTFTSAVLSGICIFIAGCQKNPAIVATPAEAKAAFDSQEALGQALERRWPISSIKEFCIPERRHDPFYQLLVADSDVVWKGKLHDGEATGFDGIEWTATTKEDGRGEAYSILVHRGEDAWEIEFGSEQSLTTPPNVSPDPKLSGFVGNDKPMKDQIFDPNKPAPPPPPH